MSTVDAGLLSPKGCREGRLRSDRGAVTVETAFWALPMSIAVFALLQLGLWWVAIDTCSTAAQQGLDTGRVLGGTPAIATDSARRFMDRASAIARNPTVDSTGMTATVMRVQVSAEVVMIVPIPGLRWHIQADAIGVRERFTAPTESGSP